MRINVVPPSELTRLHLIAEVREIKMLPKMLCRSLLSAKGVTGIPGEYTLNKGHGKFFYDKLGFISNRFAELVHECIERGYALQEDTTRLWDKSYDYTPIINAGLELWNDYEPTPEAIAVNQERIALRISQKPHLYERG